MNTTAGSRSPAPPPGPAPRPQAPVQPRPASGQQQNPNRQTQQKKKKVQKQQPKVNTAKKDPWPQVINTTLIKMVSVTGLLGDSLYRRHMNGFDRVHIPPPQYFLKSCNVILTLHIETVSHPFHASKLNHRRVQ